MLDVKTIATICRQARLDNNKTMQYIANKANCSVENISSFEHHRNKSFTIALVYMREFKLSIINGLEMK